MYIYVGVILRGFLNDDGGILDMDVNMRDIRLLFVNVPAVW